MPDVALRYEILPTNHIERKKHYDLVAGEFQAVRLAYFIVSRTSHFSKKAKHLVDAYSIPEASVKAR